MTVTDAQLLAFAGRDVVPEPFESREMAAELLRRRREETIRENAFVAEVQRRVRAEEAAMYYKHRQEPVTDSLRSQPEQDSLHRDRPPRGPWDMP